jgi:hypothetical protein
MIQSARHLDNARPLGLQVEIPAHWPTALRASDLPRVAVPVVESQLESHRIQICSRPTPSSEEGTAMASQAILRQPWGIQAGSRSRESISTSTCISICGASQGYERLTVCADSREWMDKNPRVSCCWQEYERLYSRILVALATQRTGNRCKDPGDRRWMRAWMNRAKQAQGPVALGRPCRAC